MSGAVKIWTLAAAALVAMPALADTRPMPDYFVGALVATSAAEAVALSCPQLSIDPVAVVKSSETLLSQLETDGFNVSNPSVEMESGDDKLAAAQQVFMDKHALEGASSEVVCAAGRAEIADGSAIGLLLVEVSQ